MITILLFESNTLLREGLSMLLDKHADITVKGTAETRDEAAALLQKARGANVILSNLQLESQPVFELVKHSKAQNDDFSFLALAENCTPGLVRSALLAGFDGYVLKESSLDNFVQGVRSVAAGDQYFPRVVMDLIITGFLNPDAFKDSRSGRKNDSPLTSRECEVLMLVGAGESNKMIARKLDVGIKTVEKHRANFMRKLGLKNSAQVARYAVSHGLLADQERKEYERESQTIEDSKQIPASATIKRLKPSTSR